MNNYGDYIIQKSMEKLANAGLDKEANWFTQGIKGLFRKRLPKLSPEMGKYIANLQAELKAAQEALKAAHPRLKKSLEQEKQQVARIKGVLGDVWANRRKLQGELNKEYNRANRMRNLGIAGTVGGIGIGIGGTYAAHTGDRRKAADREALLEELYATQAALGKERNKGFLARLVG